MTQSVRRIVLGIGQAHEPDPHLPPAIRLAEALGAELHVVHAYRVPDPLLTPYPEFRSYSPELAQAAEKAVRQKVEEQVANAGGSSVRSHTVPGSAAGAVLEIADQISADLIIVGATERGTVSRAVLGTTAGRVIRTSKVPVLINRCPDAEPPRRVLMTTDLSDLSARVFQAGLGIVPALAPGGDPEVRTLLVVGDDLTSPPPARTTVLETIRDRELRPFLDRLGSRVAGTEGKVRMGDAATEVVAEAEEWGADLVVLGTHGRGGFSRFLIGSVAEVVVRRTPCDVLVIPAAAVGGDGESEARG